MNLRMVTEMGLPEQWSHLRLFSRKLVINVASGRSSGSTPFLAFPFTQWLCGRNGSDLIGIGFYSYGDSAGMEPDFPFNDPELVWINRNAL